MVDKIPSVSLSLGGTTFNWLPPSFEQFIKPFFGTNKDQPTSSSGDGFESSGTGPLPQEVRLAAAVTKYNSGNNDRLIAETNRSGEIDSAYAKLLPQYYAYQNPEFKDLEFTAVSKDTIIATNKG